MMRSIKALVRLTKPGIPLLITMSTITGFVLASGGPMDGLLPTAAGIFLLASGAASLNQYQDRQIDALMERTKRRPVASGEIASRTALVFSLLLICSGGAVLYTRSSVPALIIGFTAMVLYNGVYTYHKRKSAFAFLPGAVIGALPPVAGWTAAGGFIGDSRIIAIAAFLFIWQVPHFLIILLRYQDDYGKAGLPLITDVFTVRQLKHILSLWIIATAVSSLILPLFVPLTSRVIIICLFAAALWLTHDAAKFLKSEDQSPVFRKAFLEINAYALLVLLLLSIDSILG